jgi:hypothetical protein
VQQTSSTRRPNFLEVLCALVGIIAILMLLIALLYTS